MRSNISIRIADITLTVKSPIEIGSFRDMDFYREFRLKKPVLGDCNLCLKMDLFPRVTLDADSSFNLAGNWQLFRCKEKNILQVGPPSRNRVPADTVIFNSSYSKGTIYKDGVTELFRRFLDQFVLIHLLSGKQGFLLHSSGVVWQNKGLAFIGPSGSGKSTLIKLFGPQLDKENLLNDDRLAIRKHKGKWKVFGTPWYGEIPVSSPKSAPLKALFFIKHSDRNYIRKLSGVETLTQLSVNSLVPLWDKQATSRVLVTFQELFKKIPAYEMGFLPDKRIIELIKKTI